MKQNLLSFILLCALFIGVAHAQNRQVTGRVSSQTTGENLPGATVKVVGTSISTQTDGAGNYSISAPANGSLTITNVGFTSQTVQINNRSVVNVVLAEDETSLDEVIVVAYGTVKKSDFTGSATQIGEKELDKRPLSNPLVALQGAGPGIQTSAPGGAPGSSPTIRIRGIGSYSAGSGALIVVDGVPYDGGMSNINPSDVESITVLKDAATIAMYGSRGANGVIMVTTRKGKAGSPTLQASAQFGYNQNGVPNYNTVSAGEYYELMWQAYTNNMIYGEAKLPVDIARQIGSGLLPRNAAGNQVYNGKAYQDIVQFLGNYNAYDIPNNELVSVDGIFNPNAKFKYSDYKTWEEESTRNGKRTEYNVNYSGSSNNTDFFASANYLKDNGWSYRSSKERFLGRLNLNSQIKSWLKTGMNLSAGSHTDNNASSGDGINNPFYFSRGIAPIYPVYLRDPQTGNLILDANGEKRYDYGNFVADYGLNRIFNSGRHALAETMMNNDFGNREFINARAYLDINFLPWLTLSTTFSPDFTNTRGESYENTEVGDGAPAGRYSQGWTRSYSYTFNQILRANNTFGLHNLETLLGHEVYSYKYESIDGMRTGQGFDGMHVFSNFVDIASLTSGKTESTMESYFARANYNYNSRYYLSAMIRRDGNSKFHSDLRWNNFWSIGGAWRLDQEAFFQNENINLLKLRASYGVLGNADVGYYPYQATYGLYNNASESGSAMTSLGSSALTWETQKPFDIGVDFAFLDNRINGTLEYYHRNSDGLLFSVPQPYHNGGTTGGSFAINQNVGAATNKGIELSVNGQLIRKENFNWTLGINLTTIKNEMTKMPLETPEIVDGAYKRSVGHSMYDFWLRTYYGVDPDNGNALYLGLAENATFDPKYHKVIDRGNGVMDTVTSDHGTARLSYVGKSAIAPVYGSIVNTFNYKDFEFGFVLTYGLGGYAYDGQYAGLMSAGPTNGANLHEDLLGAWKNPGDVSLIPAMNTSRTGQTSALSDRWLRKRSYLNISSINLAYTIPSQYVSRIGVKNARLYASAENLYFWSAKKGFNPVGAFTGNTGNSTYTHARTINFGVNFGF
ncbi:SusC/RagA family TonB-linked outer membrane protein [Sphingobacterium sp. PU5-4]|uniref:SusC/RagA family TonB-linked outer membrane protein n=1 Tax=Sphingobacterium tenebrionis TaxID=3111775 RepID=A0ABU8I8L9_9SPHI